MHQNTIYKVNVLCHIRPFHLLNEVDFMQSLPYNVDSLPFAQRMNYAANGRIVSKKITKNTLFGDSLIYDNHYQYTNGGNRLHSVSDHHSNDAEHRFYWDGCGNMTEWIMAEVGRRPQPRTHTWTEDNRLQTVTDNEWFSYYQYDAGGDRTYKLTWSGSVQTLNGRREVYYTPQSATLYVSPYIVATPQGYTKHYYAGAERITSQLGRGRFADVGTPVVGDSLVQAKLQAVTNKVRYPVTLTAPSSSYFSYLDTLTNRQNDTFEAYWYHTDHLGSSSWITYSDGSAVQHLHYLPFGEDFVNQKSSSFEGARYTFSAKEKDAETKYSYFGSRYYSSDLSIWLSVDPQAAKYPSLSPYTYCADNPVKLVDPNGEEVGDFFDYNGRYLGTDGIDDGKIYITTQENWDNCSQLEGGMTLITISQLGLSKEPSRTNLSDNAILSILSFYNTTDKRVVDENRLDNSLLTMHVISGKLTANTSNWRWNEFLDNSYDIKSTFDHEKGHFKQRKEIGVDAMLKMPAKECENMLLTINKINQITIKHHQTTREMWRI